MSDPKSWDSPTSLADHPTCWSPDCVPFEASFFVPLGNYDASGQFVPLSVEECATWGGVTETPFFGTRRYLRGPYPTRRLDTFPDYGVSESTGSSGMGIEYYRQRTPGPGTGIRHHVEAHGRNFVPWR